MPWRSYSMRSSFPLARSSQTRRRLLLFRDFGVVPDESDAAAESDPLPEDELTERETAFRTLWSDDVSDDEPAAAVEVAEFVDEAFEPSEARNARLKSGTADAGALDADEDETHSPGAAPPVPAFRVIKRFVMCDEPTTWMFTGESLSGGAERTVGWRSFSEQFSERVRHEMGRALDAVIDTAAEGATIRQLSEELRLRVTRFQPEVVILLIGLSDSRAGAGGLERFRTDLDDVIRRIRERGAALVLQTPPWIDVQLRPEYADLPAYVDAMREAADELMVPCVEHWAHWHQIEPAQRAVRLSADGVHPGAEGHREMARLIFRRFGIFDESSPLCASRMSGEDAE